MGTRTKKAKKMFIQIQMLFFCPANIFTKGPMKEIMFKSEKMFTYYYFINIDNYLCYCHDLWFCRKIASLFYRVFRPITLVNMHSM